MDNDNFQAQFLQDVKSNIGTKPIASQPIAPVQPNNAHAVPPSRGKLLPVIIIILTVSLLAESIALIILLNVSSLNSDTELVDNYDTVVSTSLNDPDSAYVYNNNGDLTAMNIVCTSKEGAQFVFSKNNNFAEYNASKELIDKGTYSVDTYATLSLTGNTSRTLYHNEFDLINGSTIYSCEDISE